MPFVIIRLVPRWEPTAVPPGLIVEPPSRPNGAWQLQAGDHGGMGTATLPVREWTVIAQSQLEALRELARGLREIKAGRVPP